jgi:hypothetical protein
MALTGTLLGGLFLVLDKAGVVLPPQQPTHLSPSSFRAANRKDGTLTVTLIKKIEGDREKFMKELRAVLQITTPKNPKEDVIRERTGGAIEVRGNHVRQVREWLAGLGF